MNEMNLLNIFKLRFILFTPYRYHDGKKGTCALLRRIEHYECAGSRDRRTNQKMVNACDSYYQIEEFVLRGLSIGGSRPSSVSFDVSFGSNPLVCELSKERLSIELSKRLVY